MDQKSVLIFGSGRSGTTWIQDALAAANSYEPVFEPLHPRSVPGAQRFANTYVPRGTEEKALYEFLRPWLIGGQRSLWTSTRVHPDMLFPRIASLMNVRVLKDTRQQYAKLLKRWWRNKPGRGRPRVVKFIRGNLMAEWMSDAFNLPAALVVRHPCAVLSSVAVRRGRDWQTDALRKLLDRYLEQPLVVDKILGSRQDAVNKFHTLATIQAAIWCIENAEHVSGNGSSEVPVVYYEDLLADPERHWGQLARTLGLANAPGPELLLTPSQQASVGTGVRVDVTRQLTQWQTQLAGPEIEEVDSVLRLFGVQAYSVESPMPLGRC